MATKRKYKVSSAQSPDKLFSKRRVVIAINTIALSVVFSLLSPHLHAQTPDSLSRRPSVSLTLSQAIDLAMQHNRHLRMAKLSTQDSKAKLANTKSNYFPHLSNRSTAVYLTELQGVVFPSGTFGSPSSTGPIPAQNTIVGQGAQGAFTSGTELSQPITQLFKIRAGARAATADVRSAQLDETDVTNSISLLVHQLFFSILTQQAHLEAAKHATSAAQIAEGEANRGFTEGRLLEVAALQAHAATLDQKQTVLTQQLSIDDTMLQMDDAVGLPLGTQLILDADSAVVTPKIPTRAEAYASLVSHNLKVLSAEQAVEKAKAGLSAARDTYIPDITGLARYSYQSGVPFLVHNFGTFGGTVSYDLFDGGSRGAKVKQARIELEMAETQLQQTQSDIQIEIAAGYDKVEQLEQLVSVVQEAYKARSEASRVASEQVAHTELLESSAAKDAAAVYDTKASLLEAELGLFLAKNNIQQMLGERP
jgi:outer membrane protein TolC